MTATN